MAEDSGLESLDQSLPSSWYLDQQIYDLEREHIFMREWLCVARQEECPDVGDHQVLDVFGESILLVRNQDLKLRAFYNVCRHRGAQLCATAEERKSIDSVALKGGVVGASRITCPYHAWSYDLDGQLINAPHMSEVDGFEVGNIRLHSVACDTWGGFVFIHLSPKQALPFAEHIASSAERFKRYPLTDLRVAETISYSVKANWKVLCENYNECYHCGPVHPELCKIVPAFREKGGAGLDWEQGVPHREGANTFTMSGTTTRRSFPGLDDNEKNNHKGDLIYPNLFLSLSADHVAAFVLRAKGPAETQIDCHFMFEPYEIEKAEFDASDAVDFWHLVNRQDWTICERVQRGISARVHQQGVFSPMEDWNLDIRRYVTDRIGPHIKG